MKILFSILAICVFATMISCNKQQSSQESIQKTETESSIEYQLMVQRATQAAIWAMPAVALVDFVKATRRDLGGDYNDVLYLTKPFESNHGFLTANDVTAYAWGNINIAKGPVVLEVPAATDKVSYFGSIVNAWFQPIEDIGPSGADKGKGGKYLLVPPGYEGEIPVGYIVLHYDTHDIGFAFRPRLYNGATDADAAEYAQTIQTYYLSEADNPPPTNYIHVNPHSFNSLPTYDETFFQDIDHVIQSNPIRTQDKAMIPLLKDLGIEKGNPFTPSEKQKRAINEGAAIAWETMQYFFNTPGKTMSPL